MHCFCESRREPVPSPNSRQRNERGQPTVITVDSVPREIPKSLFISTPEGVVGKPTEYWSNCSLTYADSRWETAFGGVASTGANGKRGLLRATDKDAVYRSLSEGQRVCCQSSRRSAKGAGEKLPRQNPIYLRGIICGPNPLKVELQQDSRTGSSEPGQPSSNRVYRRVGSPETDPAVMLRKGCLPQRFPDRR
jgi:hypothetical protein